MISSELQSKLSSEAEMLASRMRQALRNECAGFDMFKRVMQAEFLAHSAWLYTPLLMCYASLRFKGDPKTHELRFWVLSDGSGIGFERVADARGTQRLVGYVFALCAHDWKTMKSQMCYREYLCTKCGATRTEDSSD